VDLVEELAVLEQADQVDQVVGDQDLIMVLLALQVKVLLAVMALLMFVVEEEAQVL
jgi:hypothetical protein